MNDIDEIRQYALTHARAQRIRGYRRVLAGISHDGEGPGSWTYEWIRLAERHEQRGQHLAAARHYAMARFPVAADQARRKAEAAGVAAFDRWRTGRGIEPLNVEFAGGQFRCWTTGLSTVDPKPVLLIMGGIVTVKEQWAAALQRVHRLGMAGVVTELPGIGENSASYHRDSWRMLPALLDTIGTRADTAQTYAMALSFSGHLALRAATADDRIRAIITTAAPVADFFTDHAWQPRIPRITLDVLAHLTGRNDADRRDWALTDEELAALRIPVRYVACRRDEIIPPGEAGRLTAWLPDVVVLEHDDVHGAPRHVTQTQLWSVRELLRMRGVRGAQAALLGGLMHGTRLLTARRRS